MNDDPYAVFYAYSCELSTRGMAGKGLVRPLVAALSTACCRNRPDAPATVGHSHSTHSTCSRSAPPHPGSGRRTGGATLLASGAPGCNARPPSGAATSSDWPLPRCGWVEGKGPRIRGLSQLPACVSLHLTSGATQRHQLRVMEECVRICVLSDR